ncbi:MAG: hypothetical protein QOC94_4209, partial [Actinoplanes sp.]|nr:hypothetical protein [Actinoplanes sp.]
MRGDFWLDGPAAGPVVRGLGRNPAAPADVLLGLLERHGAAAVYGLRRHPGLPSSVVTALLQHPQPHVRGALANYPPLDPGMREQLLDDPVWRVRVRAFGVPGQRPLSDEALVRLLSMLDDPPANAPFTRVELLEELFFAVPDNQQVLRLAVAHPRPGVRAMAAGLLQVLDEPARQALLTDPSPELREAATDAMAYMERVREPADLPDHHCHQFWEVLRHPLSQALIEQVLASDDLKAVAAVAANPSTPTDVVAQLVSPPAPQVRRGAAGRAD